MNPEQREARVVEIAELIIDIKAGVEKALGPMIFVDASGREVMMQLHAQVFHTLLGNMCPKSPMKSLTEMNLSPGSAPSGGHTHVE